ncbi:DUF3427 domain-containing protein [Luteimonas yindakuii]|uniref:DUF3427 domain-containing protein n=1 Tax=Luteimonas yindakuii TaxID=2565782 RepID=UPI001424291C|nr:DUF3427 domain-containing protein [Luteimonas yindakuii]
MLDVVRGAFRSARDVSIAVSFFRYSGLGLVADELRALEQRGGTLRLLVSTYMCVTQPDALRAVLRFPNVTARLHLACLEGAKSQGFHAKMYVIDEPSECWVGSSNFTKGGLSTNIEANLRHAGAVEVSAAQTLFEQLWSRDDAVPLTMEVIETYERSIPKQVSLAPPSGRSLLDVQGTYNAHVKPNAAQAEALDRLKELRESGERRAAIVAAPGIGKTFLAAFDARARNARSLLFLSNRLEHLTQALRTFQQVFGNSRIFGEVFGGQAEAQADFVFATVSSASNSTALLEREFDYVVVDEFHHAAAKSYRALIDRLSPRFLLGLTATPERQDGHDVLALCDYNVAYEVRLVEAINRGWLLPFHYFGVSDDSVNYSAIPWRSGFDPEQLEIALMVEARVDAMLEQCRLRGFDGPKRVAVGFCAGVRHARYMADALVRRGLEARAVTGADSVAEREAIYARLQDPSDPLEWLFVADVLNEGVDLPAINCLVFLRPTESATIFIQQLGRGLRLTPHSEVLTVLDFVGHHRTAWLAVEALNDRAAPIGPTTVRELDITPPEGCEIVLDARTVEILEKVRRFAPSRKDVCLATYKRLKEELDIARPHLVDLLSDPGMPTPSDVRTAFGSWIGVRLAAGDTEPWESRIAVGGPAFDLLLAAEKDWQAQRVYAYAALWGMCARPDDPMSGYEAFYARFPRWQVEYKPFAESKVAETLKRKLGELFDGTRLVDTVLREIPSDCLLAEVEGRLQYTLENDFRLRHGGVLRRPADLGLHRSYSRPEIVNHFGNQYDPARHNKGVLRFEIEGGHTVIITKLDTSGAVQRHQYVNALVGASRFLWTSQNQQAQDNSSGREILEHRQRGNTLHLFVQPGSHSPATYLGVVDVAAVEGDRPMRVTFDLRHVVPPAVLAQLGAGDPSLEIRKG